MVSLSPFLGSAVKTKTKENSSTCSIQFAYSFHIFLRWILLLLLLTFMQPTRENFCKKLLLLKSTLHVLITASILYKHNGGSGDTTTIAGKGLKRFLITNLIFWLIFFKHFSMDCNLLSPKLTGVTTQPLFGDITKWKTHLNYTFRYIIVRTKGACFISLLGTKSHAFQHESYCV